MQLLTPVTVLAAAGQPEGPAALVQGQAGCCTRVQQVHSIAACCQNAVGHVLQQSWLDAHRQVPQTGIAASKALQLFSHGKQLHMAGIVNSVSIRTTSPVARMPWPIREEAHCPRLASGVTALYLNFAITVDWLWRELQQHDLHQIVKGAQ